MKKVSLLFTFLLVAFAAKAQDYGSMENTSENSTGSDYNSYNHWSIEAQGGLSKPTRPVSSGYSSDFDWWQGDLGVRYMINELFGFKLSAGYNRFKFDGPTSGVDNDLYRASLEGVVNAGSLLGFRDWTQTLNFLVHGGAGYGYLDNTPSGSKDNLGYFVVGITPQLRLSDRFALTLDGSFVGDFDQDVTYDGLSNSNTRGFNGYHFNASVGLTYYFGSEKHADWHVRKTYNNNDEVARLRGEIDDLESRVANNENEFNEYTRDDNNNGVPDALEEELDKRYQDEGNGDASDIIKKLIDEGYVNVYFKFDSAEPATYSLDAINYLVKYMTENTSADAELVGYADAIGNPDYNEQLSEKRAETVKNILVANGVDESRLSTRGSGEDDSVDEGSTQARQLVRRVTFKLK